MTYKDITQAQLLAIMPNAKSRVNTFLQPLNAAMKEFGIDTPLRQAAFLAQIAHESASLLYVKEIASGAAYEGRKDLGNTQKGDGVRYKGRGLLQITGRANYVQLMMALDIDCVEYPEIVETVINACRSAAWWWSDRKLNVHADKKDFVRITKIINGGTNGLADRQQFYDKALKELT